jgi:hypothetical protein
MKKNLDYKIVYLDENYNFYIKFIFIRVQTKILQFFER